MKKGNLKEKQILMYIFFKKQREMLDVTLKKYISNNDKNELIEEAKSFPISKIHKESLKTELDS